MAREYDMYLQLHELQPSHHYNPYHQHQLQHHGPSASAAAPQYEVTGAAGAAGTAEPPAPAAPPPQGHRKRKIAASYGGGSSGSTYDDDGSDDTRSARMQPDKKQNHSEIEKRRRDKMNTYIGELSGMIPMCRAMARKLDKLTVLRMAVTYLRSVRGAQAACPLSARPRPAFLSERELNQLVLRAAHDCFLLVVGCDRGRLLYVSASVQRMLHYQQSELLGQSLFDLLHPKDVAKVKEQLSSSDLNPRERLIDAKTMLPVKADVVCGGSRLCPGARRSFVCRVRARPDAAAAPPDPPPARKKTADRRYRVIQCTGYLKSWAPAEVCEGGGGGAGGAGGASESGDAADDDAVNLSCLVAVARALPPPPQPHAPHHPHQRPLQYVSRHATDGKFLFVDQRVTGVLGYLPQELVGTSLYEYVSGGALGEVARAHKAALRRAPLAAATHAHRRKDGSYARIHTHFKHLHNPWTRDVECLVANNTLVADDEPHPAPPDPLAAPPPVQHYDIFKTEETEGSVGRLASSAVESHAIGSAIAEEALRRGSPGLSPELPADLLHDAVFTQSSLVDVILGGGEGGGQVRNNVSLSAAAGGASPPPAAAASPPLPPLALDGNGEAAMAVIMNLLEADAGLGGPVNLSGLPWLLP